MATYAIGDVQGCFGSLQQLLKTIQFNQKTDTLWFTGDLVNRGPESLETLRFIKNLGESAVTVLGNHDLMLLGVAFANLQAEHNCEAILKADDSQALLDWLLSRPLLHFDKQFNTTLVHAGILPLWDLKTAQALAKEAESVLQGPDHVLFLKNMGACIFKLKQFICTNSLQFHGSCHDCGINCFIMFCF